MNKIGDVIAGYRLDELIGEGGMGVVWAATQISLDRTVALKVVRSELAADSEFRDRFVTESRIAASLEDPNVVSVYDAGEESEILYLAMSFIEGTDLRALLRERGSLDPQSAVAVISQVALGLKAVHDAGLVHRDVKPANVLIRSRDGKAMLTDFGLARAVNASKITRTGMLIGTLDYMAPEQIEGKRIDGRSDVYSLGAVLYETLVGKPPFAGETVAAQIHAHLSEPPPRPSEHDPSLAGFDSLIVSALSKDPGERPDGPVALAEAARTVMGGEASTTGGFREAVTEVSEASAQTRVHRRRAAPAHRDPRADDGARTTTSEAASASKPRTWLIGTSVAVAALALAALLAVALLPGGSTGSDATTPEATVASPEPQTVTVERTVQRDTSVATAPPLSTGDWPSGSGYTAILASVGSRSEAESKAALATSKGLDAGLLYSSDYSSLRPGYWVVFSGTFQSQTEASQRASRAQDLGYSDAYPRFVAP